MTATDTLILIVEDDPDTCAFLTAALARHGMETCPCASVGEALVRLEELPMPTAVILDLGLPDAKGTILLRRIRRNDLPIRVAVVSGADPGDYGDLVRFPPDRVFAKPIDLRALVAWLGEPD